MTSEPDPGLGGFARPGEPVPDVTDIPLSPRPRDYQLLVPRDWFRVDLVRDRWRGQLKTFVDLQTDGKSVPAETKRGVWTVLRNTAEAGLAHGAMEFYLRPELDDEGLPIPASLLVSLIPTPGARSVTPQGLASSLVEREADQGRTAEVSAIVLPAGQAVRVLRATSMDLHVHMPGGVGYLVLSFSAPVNGVAGSMRRLCDAIAESLRWIM